ncbi:MAG: hypothetical protein A2X49_11320 [Lentisphaerae bacterium GWF2_52_8]|nr:MAG: hypothetical protein A2X49_11320 [Lentisphaerae bacterium GWF2_52_8]
MGKIYDGHIHLMPPHGDSPSVFEAKAKSVGIDGGMIISYPPADSRLYVTKKQKAPSNEQRISEIISYCAKISDYYPCYWINPTEPDAVDQVKYAKEQGIAAIKVICSKYPPSAGLKAYRKCAELNLPVLFHSGILWDGEVSAEFNRPAAFECLLEVYGLRFALAHVSWPWCDECIALYGKLRQAQFAHPDRKLDMYIDICPGVPDISREDVFKKLVLIGYDVKNSLIFGIDSTANSYDCGWAKYVCDFDLKLFKSMQEKYASFKGYFAEGSFMAADGGNKWDFPLILENAMTQNLLRFLKG